MSGRSTAIMLCHEVLRQLCYASKIYDNNVMSGSSTTIMLCQEVLRQ